MFYSPFPQECAGTIPGFTQIEQAISEGFDTVFRFFDDYVISFNDDTKFKLCAAMISGPFVCYISSMIVYRIETYCGKKGYVAISFDDSDLNE